MGNIGTIVVVCGNVQNEFVASSEKKCDSQQTI